MEENKMNEKRHYYGVTTVCDHGWEIISEGDTREEARERGLSQFEPNERGNYDIWDDTKLKNFRVWSASSAKRNFGGDEKLDIAVSKMYEKEYFNELAQKEQAEADKEIMQLMKEESDSSKKEWEEMASSIYQ